MLDLSMDFGGNPSHNGFAKQLMMMRRYDATLELSTPTLSLNLGLTPEL